MSTKVMHLVSLEKEKTWKTISHNLVLHVPSGYYYVRKFKAGKRRLFKTTGCKKRGMAQNIADNMEMEWRTGRLPASGKRPRVDQVIDELEVHLQKLNKLPIDHKEHRRDETILKDKVMFKIMREIFGHEPVDAIDLKYWEDWLETDGAERGGKLGEISKYLSKILTFAERKGYIRGKPTIKNPDQFENKAETFDTSKLKEMAKITDPLAKMQLCLGMQHGMRPVEIRKLEKECVQLTQDEQGKAITVIHIPRRLAKNKKPRSILMTPDGDLLMRDWIKNHSHPRSPYVFCQPTDPSKPQTRVHQNRCWKRALRSVGIRSKAWQNWLRHTFYTSMILDNGVPIEQVSEFGGTSVATLQKHYLHADHRRTSIVSKVSGEKMVRLNVSKLPTSRKEK